MSFIDRLFRNNKVTNPVPVIENKIAGTLDSDSGVLESSSSPDVDLDSNTWKEVRNISYIRLGKQPRFKAWKIATQILSEVSNHYHELLLEFQDNGKYSKINLDFVIENLPDSPDGRTKMGETKVRYIMKDNTYREIDGTGVTLANIKDFQLRVALNSELLDGSHQHPWIQVILTLVHELAVHAEKLARVLSGNSTIEEKIALLLDESPDVHHAEMIASESLFNKIINEVLSEYRDSSKGTAGPPWFPPAVFFETSEEDVLNIAIKCTYNFMLMILRTHDGEYISEFDWADYVLSSPSELHTRKFKRND